MNKPLLLSLAVFVLLATEISAASMDERFEAMEKEMKELKKEIATLKSQQTVQNTVVQKVEDKEDKESKDDEDEIASTEDRLFDLEEAVSEINRNTSGSHLKFQVDYRFAIENLGYKMADGSRAKNDGFMTNRLWIDMGYKATNHLSFVGQLAYNKAFGARSGANNPNSASLEAFQ